MALPAIGTSPWRLFGTSPAPSLTFASTGLPTGRQTHSLSVDSIEKAAKNAKSVLKYFDGTGRSDEASHRFWDWISFWKDVCLGKEPRLGAYFSLCALSLPDEQALTSDRALDQLVFSLLKTYLHGPAA